MLFAWVSREKNHITDFCSLSKKNMYVLYIDIFFLVKNGITFLGIQECIWE